MPYKMTDVGGDLSAEEFQIYVLEQLREIELAFLRQRPRVLTAEPKQPYEGLIVIADGTDWNPGSGAGYYGYRDGAWRPLE